MTAGLIIIFAGYTIASYGLVLLLGYDIPFKRWIDPTDAWQWPADIPKIPATQVWP
jgi:hypothetical protein